MLVKTLTAIQSNKLDEVTRSTIMRMSTNYPLHVKKLNNQQNRNSPREPQKFIKHVKKLSSPVLLFCSFKKTSTH